MMDHVDENVRFYCMTDQSRLRRYIDRYLKEYLNYAQAEEVWQIIDSYLARHTCAESGYRANVVIGTPFVNDLYYQTSWKAAQALFSSDAISSLQSSFRFLDGYNPMVPPQKTFVICFDGGLSLRFYFDVPDGQCRVDNTISQQFTNNFSNTLLIQSKDFHCSAKEYDKSLRRYILFLSNWMLILSCWMSMHEFGQFAFGLYWETGTVGLLQKQQHNKWWQTH